MVGPDPSAPPEEQLQPKDGDLIIPEPMQWMVDFERARYLLDAMDCAVPRRIRELHPAAKAVRGE